jgi:hypothetical protein
VSRLVAYHIFIKHPSGNPVIVMQNISNANETLLLLTQSAQAKPCDCQNSENASAENVADNGQEQGGSQSGGQCTDGVCQLNWKPARPAA